jgi:CRP/FNR family transcriptional regulator/CRP/FNR family cyclic AMP-dependent transcriptional regulator
MAILDGEARSASVRAVTDCHLLSIYQRDFNDLIAQHPTIASAVIATLNERLRNTLDLLQRDRK